ncbi:putative FAD-binding domain, FAD/NAD(P)-binding domain superfamily [Helianthus annuus]|nr:putative FAD-binding domain, FAD/NAD(P)-binding domain superfamily [Helianthus annuus]
MRESKGRAVVVGGSIAGVSAVHSLLSAGWEVVVLEKTTAPPTGSPTGAGLGLDPLSQSIIKSWLPHQQSDLLLNTHTLPLTIDQNQATDAEKKISRVLARDESFNFRAAYWSDLHNLLYNALPPDIFYWGHVYQSFSVSDDKNTVKVQSKVVQTGNVVEFEGDLLVAADGCLSSIRQAFLPDLKLRYSGYCAWRGVLDLSSDEKSDIFAGLQNVYQDLGKCLYFDLGSGTHSVFYELLNKKINWIWYVNQPEPQLKGNSVTMKVSNDMIKKMQEEAEKTWVPELVRVIKETKEPFLNVIYDCDPLQQIVWDRVVLIGDAAHPTTPHGVRSTNMSILDAAVLGQCLMKSGVEKLGVCLEEYQSIRVPVTSKQVLQSRKMGRMKQGLVLADGKVFDPKTATPQEYNDLQQKYMPGFSDMPYRV